MAGLGDIALRRLLAAAEHPAQLAKHAGEAAALSRSAGNHVLGALRLLGKAAGAEELFEKLLRVHGPCLSNESRLRWSCAPHYASRANPGEHLREADQATSAF